MEKELFDLLYGAAKSTYDSYLYNVWTTMALAVGSIGWLLTSDSARYFLGTQRTAQYISMLCVALILVIHCIVLFDTQNKSQQIHSLLELDGYVTKNAVFEAYYSQYLIPLRWPITSSILNGSLFSLLILFIWLTPNFIVKKAEEDTEG
jgi:hypothetical protein